MLQRAETATSQPSWRRIMADAVTDVEQLFELLALPQELLPAARSASRLFPLRIPKGYLSRMYKGDPNDPLLRQVLPLEAEHDKRPGYSADPVGDLNAMMSPGVLHKYRGRALLIATGACAVHCRYCFRRHFPYGQANSSRDHWKSTLRYVEQNETISEVILSGGDPLSLSDQRLRHLALDLARFPHVRRLRIHTRLPIVIPERVNDELLDWLNGSRLKPVMVLHVNHAQELNSPTLRGALSNLNHSGTTLLNQSVLLRNVNDRVEDLVELSEGLFHHNVTPYYLHLLDKVDGATHFEVNEMQARALYEQLLARLPGYLVPRLVQEVPGAPSKTPVGSVGLIDG